MKPVFKCGNIGLALLLLYAALIPYSHCSVDQAVQHKRMACGSACSVASGAMERHLHAFDLHTHDPESANDHHFHFLLDGNWASRNRFDPDTVTASPLFLVNEAAYSVDVYFAAGRPSASSPFVRSINPVTVASGLSPPV